VNLSCENCKNIQPFSGRSAKRQGMLLKKVCAVALTCIFSLMLIGNRVPHAPSGSGPAYVRIPGNGDRWFRAIVIAIPG
jgi:hypothetical protein